MEEDISKFSKLEEIVRDINTRLEKLVERNELEEYEKNNLIRYTHRVLKKLVGKRTRVKEGVEKLMGGEIIVTDVDLVEKENALAEKENALAEKDNALAEKDNALAEKENALAEKDAEILHLKELLAKSASKV